MESTQSWIANIAILNKKLTEESWYNTIWAKFGGFTDISMADNGQRVYRPAGKPIEILNDFVSEGRDNMLIPFLKDLVGAPVLGDTTLKGTGEDQIMWWLRAYVNQFRKAVIQKTGSMSEQRQKLYKLYDQTRPQLVKWFAKYHNQEISRAFYEGVSQNLSASTASDGLGLYKRYHPNFYINDGGVVTKVATTEGQTPTAAELDTAVTNNDQAMDAEFLMKLRIKVMQKNIPQIVTEDGFKFWAILAHPDQLNTLYTDTTAYAYTTAAQAAFQGMQKKYPLIETAVAYYAGFAIYEDIIAVRGWDNSTGGFFGDDDASPITSEFTVTSDDNRCGIVFGNGAIGKAIATPLHFTNEVDDHGNVVEIGGAEISGYNRADFAAEADAYESTGDLFRKNTTGGVASGLVADNQSSLIFMTNEA